MVILSGEAGVGKTAVIKDFYDVVKEKIPFFVFKATEFNVPNINQLFSHYGEFTLSTLINEFEGIPDKYIIIDSAEKLSDIEHQEVFQQLISDLLTSKWKIIFTTRYSYLEDLKFQFVEVCRVPFQSLNINNLTITELTELSENYGFNLPAGRLLDLLLNPFYLNEYLRNYESFDINISGSAFKDILWNKQIVKTAYRKDNIHVRRKECFLSIARQRSTEGHFFVKPDSCDFEALHALEVDEIIIHDPTSGGYFITHDIYEEWALDKIIERDFRNSSDYTIFFHQIGSSLPVRRAFRIWLSDKLAHDKDSVKSIVEVAILDNRLETYWKDEIYVSVLLSDYARIFFEMYKEKLLENNQKLLMRMIFLLRIACKEIDENALNFLGIKKTAVIALKTLFTKPKGAGWNCIIELLHKHIHEFGFVNIPIILPLLGDWNNKNNHGESTRKASQIALYYYDEITRDGSAYAIRDENLTQVIRVILQGTAEITNELKLIFDEIISKKQKSHRDKYYEMVKVILTSMTDGIEVIRLLPSYVIRLADLFWFQDPEKEERFGNSSIGIERHFGLSEKYEFNYFSASPFQTPIFQLLGFSPEETCKFILSFTNKCVECYANSKLKDEVETITLFIDDKTTVRQYISNRLWNTYRGTQVSTYLLESIHMALEKWLFGNAKNTSKEVLESWCIYLLKESKSASITAIVTSIVLAQPSKLFNIAKILFRTKELYLYDTSRMFLDLHYKSQLTGLKETFPSFDFNREVYENERIAACDDAHRKMSLENLALSYQFFRSEGETEEEVKRRQETIWQILDGFYAALPPGDVETKSDKTWRLYLARMDRRKMSPQIEKKDGQVLITFNPEIDPELRKYSEDSLNKSSSAMKYTPLKLWAGVKFCRENDKCKTYEQYDTNPHLVIQETKEIIEGLKNQKTDDDSFFLFNHSTPAYTCSVLIRDYFEQLTLEERQLCKEVCVQFASAPVKSDDYHYQISDGTEPSISVLPNIMMYFPQDKENAKTLMFLLLLNPWREVSIFTIRAILQTPWQISFEDANALFLGYLLLKLRYNQLRHDIRKSNIGKKIYEMSERQVTDVFLNAFKKELQNIISNRINYGELTNLENLDLDILVTAFELLPEDTTNNCHLKYLNLFFGIISKKLFDRDERYHYEEKRRFFNKYAYFILNCSKSDILVHLKPFIDNFNDSQEMADFFQEFVSVEDRLFRYDQFWIVWNAFYENIKNLCKSKRSYSYTTQIIHNYLLAWPYWKEDAKEWHTLTYREKPFLKRVAEDIGHHPSVLYSISKLLNDIGSGFIDDGISWLSNIFRKNSNLISEALEINTVYYLENIVRKFILTNHHRVKTTLSIKNDILTILNFLIEKGSITAYLLREDIL
jgi:hypothetical protein